MAKKSDVNLDSKIKPSISDELYTTSYSMRSTDSKSEKFVDPGTSFEVFRNNTTAVEVIVKEVPTRSKKIVHQKTTEISQSMADRQDERKDGQYQRMLEEIEQLKSEVNRANKKCLTVKKDVRCLVFELKKQLDVVCQREFEEEMKNVTLQLENEKLKTMLDSKSAIINRLKKELLIMKRTMKYVAKGIGLTPQVPDSLAFTSDIEYDDFEKGLKKDNQVKFVNLEGLPTGVAHTFDSTLPSFDKY